ncbi:uncharacterized protein [Amphiura filiformis]|uniref:uncharacterized protein n=1 Tax=Amphiura filiformis TaxID=82378 RepID=UPI003B20C499
MASNAGNTDDSSADSSRETDQPSAKSCKMDESTNSNDEQAMSTTTSSSTSSEQKSEGEKSNVQETNKQSEPVAMVTQEGDASTSESADTTETVASAPDGSPGAAAASSQSEGRQKPPR